MFYRGSRYEPIAEAEITTPASRTVRYKRVRFIPETRGVLPYSVTQGDRLDLISHRAYGDPEQFWRICDGNTAMRPNDLIAELGRRLAIPLAGR